MSDIFISYKSEDKDKAAIFAKAFEQQGWSVFWDKSIPPGKTFDQYIGEMLTAAKCIVVLWSEKAVESDWVKEEAQRGVSRKILVPVFIETVSPPLGFGRIEAAELIGWEGDTANGEYQNLVKAIEAHLSPPTDTASPASPDAKKKKKEIKKAQKPPSRSRKKYVFGGLALVALVVTALAVMNQLAMINAKNLISEQPPMTPTDPAPSAAFPGLFADGNIDAAVNHNDGKVFFFRGDEYIRYDIEANSADEYYPQPINDDTWPGLTFRDNIDAAFSDSSYDFFFKGDQYIMYDIEADTIVKGFPLRGFLPDLFSGDIHTPASDIDAMVSYDGKVFFFKGDQYIRFDIDTNSLDEGYPKLISDNWPGLFSHDIDAAIVWNDGKVYFFKGDQYIQYDIETDRADDGYPQPISGGS